MTVFVAHGLLHFNPKKSMVLGGIRTAPAYMWSYNASDTSHTQHLRPQLSPEGVGRISAWGPDSLWSLFPVGNSELPQAVVAGKTESPPSETREGSLPPSLPTTATPKTPPSPAANCWPSPQEDKEARQEKQGKAPLPLTTPKRKGLRHSHGYRDQERPPICLRPWREPRGHCLPSTSLVLPGILITPTSHTSPTQKGQN